MAIRKLRKQHELNWGELSWVYDHDNGIAGHLKGVGSTTGLFSNFCIYPTTGGIDECISHAGLPNLQCHKKLTRYRSTGIHQESLYQPRGVISTDTVLYAYVPQL